MVLSCTYKLRNSPKSSASKKRRITRTSALPLYRQFGHALMEGEWSPGDRLCLEHELCEGYVVSRSVVHQALNEQAKEGLLHKVKGLGLICAREKIDSALVQQVAGFCEERYLR
jgi:DNA-binding GntR family transcriptional regulator